jgi:hypothetical protein
MGNSLEKTALFSTVATGIGLDIPGARRGMPMCVWKYRKAPHSGQWMSYKRHRKNVCASQYVRSLRKNCSVLNHFPWY